MWRNGNPSSSSCNPRPNRKSMERWASREMLKRNVEEKCRGEMSRRNVEEKCRGETRGYSVSSVVVGNNK